MANLATVALRNWRGTIPLLAALTLGCVSTGAGFWPGGVGEKKVPCQIACAWQNSVVFAPDTVRNGTPMPGLAGRLYVFGPEVDFPMEAEGTLTVELYDAEGGKPEVQERWIIDPKTLARLGKKDMIGWGYTLFLPWSKYSPQTGKVRLRAALHLTKGSAALFAEDVVTLAAENGVMREGKTPLTATGARKGK